MHDAISSGMAPLTPQERRQQEEDRNHHMDAEHADTEYSRIAPVYDELYFNKAAEVEGFLRKADLQPGMNVLDLGTGTAAVARTALARVGPTGRIVALDCCFAILKVAFANNANRGITLTHCDALDIRDRLGAPATIPTFSSILPHDKPLPPDFAGFDRILALGLFNDIALHRRVQALQHWATFLAPNGAIVLESFPLTRDIATVSYQPVPGRVSAAYTWPQASKDCIWLATDESFQRAATDGMEVTHAAGLQSVNKGRLWKRERFFDGLSRTIRPEVERRWMESGRYFQGTMPHQFLEGVKREIVQREHANAKGKGWQFTWQTAAVVLYITK